MILRTLNICYIATLFVNGRDDSSGTAIVAELAKIDSLPCAQIELAVGNRNGKADSEEGTLGVGWHVVCSLHGVVIVWFPFLDQVIEDLFHITAHIRVCVFIKRKRA